MCYSLSLHDRYGQRILGFDNAHEIKYAAKRMVASKKTFVVDGLYTPSITLPCRAIIKGDSLIYQILAVSILAKVARDAEMVTMDDLYPGYDFASHKGYSTVTHRDALKRLGACPIHRRSYAPVAED